MDTMDTCRLWVSLGSGRRHRAEPQPTTFLQFIRTGMLVGLPDEPGGQLFGDGPLKQFPMRRVDAEGLGLTAEDFAEGVAICREDPGSGGVGWQCERVQLLIGAEERVDALAPRMQAAGQPRSGGAPPPARPTAAVQPRRILAVVDADAAEDPAVDEAAALARAYGAALLLVATGELAETSRHAAEEHAALTLRLQVIAARFADLSVRCLVAMGGDPVRDILAVADREGADLIIAPASHSRFADAVEPRIADALGRRATVPVRTVRPAEPGAASARAPASERVARPAGEATTITVGSATATIRPVAAGDREALLALWEQSGLGATAPDQWEALTETGTSVVLVADRVGALIGSAVASFDGWRAFVYHVAVAPAERRHGVGHELMRAAEQYLLAAGARYVYVTVHEQNTEGLALVAATGYLPEGELVLAKRLATRVG